MKHVISINDFSKEQIDSILSLAQECEKTSPKKVLEAKIIASLFFEPSTRTRLSFESAAKKLGAKVLTVSDIHSSSVSKGESLSDTIRMVTSYVDAIILRHKLEGAPRRASEVATVPVINAGDGANQHPSQTLLDLYAIQKTQGKLNDISIAIVGDLKYGRTTHSLSIALEKYNCTFYFIAPDQLQMPQYILDSISNYTLLDSYEKILPKIDILYMTRIQKERFGDDVEYRRFKHAFRIEKEHLQNVKETLKILHPLPRVDEIHTNVDDTPYAHYFTQAADGIYVRQALLMKLL